MCDNLSNRLSQFYNSNKLPWIIICVGAALRLIRYFYNPSLYFDEANTVLDIINRSFMDLKHPSPDYEQTYPLSFLMLNKLVIFVFGKSEYAFRLLPLMFGTVSVVLFYYVAKHYIGPEATPVALFFFAILDPLVYYSSIVKPYSGDVAVALIIFALVIYFRSKTINLLRIFLFALGGAAILWFSNASVFVLAGVGTGLIISCFISREWAKFKSLSIIFLFWGISFIAYYYIYLESATANIALGVEEMLKMEQAFMPFPPKSVLDIKWFVDTFLNTFNFHESSDFGSRLNLTGIAALAFLIGCISLYSRNKEKFFVLMSPIMVTLLASAMHKYPFKGRLILFLAPLFILFIAEGTKQIWDKTRHNSLAIGIIFIGLLFIYPVSWAAYHAKKPISRSEIKPVLSYIKNNWKDGDIIYVHYYAQYEFDYYSKHYPQPFNFNEHEYITGIAPRGWYNRWKRQWVSKYYNTKESMNQTRNDILKLYMNDLNQLRGHKRVWVLFSGQTSQGSIKEEDFFLFHLDSIGEQLDTFGKWGVTATYLYDLSGEAT